MANAVLHRDGLVGLSHVVALGLIGTPASALAARQAEHPVDEVKGSSQAPLVSPV